MKIEEQEQEQGEKNQNFIFNSKSKIMNSLETLAISASGSGSTIKMPWTRLVTKRGLPARRPGRKPKYAIPELFLSQGGEGEGGRSLSNLPQSFTNAGILILTEEFQFDFQALMAQRNKR